MAAAVVVTIDLPALPRQDEVPPPRALAFLGELWLVPRRVEIAGPGPLQLLRRPLSLHAAAT